MPAKRSTCNGNPPRGIPIGLQTPSPKLPTPQREDGGGLQSRWLSRGQSRGGASLDFTNPSVEPIPPYESLAIDMWAAMPPPAESISKISKVMLHSCETNMNGVVDALRHQPTLKIELSAHSCATLPYATPESELVADFQNLKKAGGRDLRGFRDCLCDTSFYPAPARTRGRARAGARARKRGRGRARARARARACVCVRMCECVCYQLPPHRDSHLKH